MPPPLEPEVEEAMIEQIDTNEAKCILIEHNLRLVAFIAKRFENTGANIEELISIGHIAFFVVNNTAGACGSLVQSHYILSHNFLRF